MGYPVGVSHILVPVAGLEPARCRHRWILSPLRLPIPSHRQVLEHYSISFLKYQVESLLFFLLTKLFILAIIYLVPRRLSSAG